MSVKKNKIPVVKYIFIEVVWLRQKQLKKVIDLIYFPGNFSLFVASKQIMRACLLIHANDLFL